jgi:hypothetical protein
MEKKHSKKPYDKITRTNNIPNHCPFIEEVATVSPLPSGSCTRHAYLDGNVYQYAKDKPSILQQYCEMQGRDESAFNGSDKWVWDCRTIHKYLRGNTGEVIERGKEKCKNCPLMKDVLTKDIQPLIETKDKDVVLKIVKDIIKSKLEASPLDREAVFEEIVFLTNIKREVLDKEFKFCIEIRNENNKKLNITAIKQEEQKVIEPDKFDMEIKIGNNRKIINDNNGIHIERTGFTKQGETYKILEKNVHTWHIQEICQIKNEYIDEFIYKIIVSDWSSTRSYTGNIDFICDELKKLPGCSCSVGLKDYISPIIGYFQQMRLLKIEENPLMNAFGFFVDKNKKIVARLIYENTKLKKDVTRADLQSGIVALMDLINTYAKNDWHKKELIKLFALNFIKTFGYCRKQQGMIDPLVIIIGSSGTGKSFSGYLYQGAWGTLLKTGFEYPASSIKSNYQLAKKCSQSTLSIVVNECGQLLTKIEENSDMSELLKNSIESAGPLYKTKAGEFLSTSTIIATANYRFKFASEALRVKTAVSEFGELYKHTGDERAAIMSKLTNYETELSYIGSWVTQQLQVDDSYQKIILMRDAPTAGMQMLARLINDAGLSIELPEPKQLGYYEQTNVTDYLTDMLEVIRQTIFARFRDVAAKDDRSDSVTFEKALDVVTNTNNLPSWLAYLSKKNCYFISAAFQQVVAQTLKTPSEYGALEHTANLHNLDYKKAYQFNTHGSKVTRNGILIEKSKFCTLFKTTDYAEHEPEKTDKNLGDY